MCLHESCELYRHDYWGLDLSQKSRQTRSLPHVTASLVPRLLSAWLGSQLFNLLSLTFCSVLLPLNYSNATSNRQTYTHGERRRRQRHRLD
jgi:hypothetical protein